MPMADDDTHGPAAGGSVTVMLVDDHAVVREGLRLMLESDSSDLRVVAEAGSVAEAHDRLAAVDVDVALIDIVLPDGDGLQLCRRIRRAHPTTACVILTSFPDAHLLLAAAVSGASHHLNKNARPEQVREAVRAAARSEPGLDDLAMARALESVSQEYADDDLLRELTDQERRVFALVGQGLSNGQIADRMHLTEKTIKNYVSRMLGKLGMDRRTEAAVLAGRLAERRIRQHHPSAPPHDARQLREG